MNDHINHLWLKFSAAVVSLSLMDWLNTVGKVCASFYAIAVLAEWIWKRTRGRRRR